MATFQDVSLGIFKESTYKTYGAATRFPEILDQSMNWAKQVKQGQGLRVGGRVARSARRVVPAADGGGDFTMEATSKGMGLIWEGCLGSSAVTLVLGTTYQHNFTLGDTPPSWSVQTGIPEVGGTVDAYSWLGCMVGGWEFTFANSDIAQLKVTLDAGDLTTAQAYTTPSYVATPTLFHFANATLYTGTLTAPTTTALASATTATANVRSGSIAVNNNLRNDRFNVGGSGRKSKPTVGLREITGSLEIEYDSTTYRDLVLNDNPMVLLVQLTGAALSSGNETLQVVLPEIKLDGDLPVPNGTDLITQSVKFTALDNLTAAQPLWVVMRTADSAV